MSDIRLPVFHCPFCGKVKKLDEWVAVSTEELVKLYRSATVRVIGLVCPNDEHLKHK
jgi:hypothetical protein